MWGMLCLSDLLGWTRALCGPEEQAVGRAVCSRSPSRGLSLSSRLLNALGWMLSGEKIQKHAWFCRCLKLFSFDGGVNSPPDCVDAAEDSSAY